MSLVLDPARWRDFPDEIDGDVQMPGVWLTLVARRGEFSSIYGFRGDGAAHTRDVLLCLKHYGGSVHVHDPGEQGTPSRSYWDKMASEGLVDAMFDEVGEAIEIQRAQLPTPARPI